MSTPDDGSLTSVAHADASAAAVTVAATTRRVPPPCWTDEETLALVNAYKEKWFALRRGNLRAADWDDVAASVSASSSGEGPPKSAIQCRHKIEKLRKRYRAEKQRCLNRPGKFSSSWDLFPLLDAMGFAPPTPAAVESQDPDMEHDYDIKGGPMDGFRASKSKRFGKLDAFSDCGRDLGDGFGFRSRAKNHMQFSGGFKGEFDSDYDSSGGFGLKRKYNGNFKPSVDLDGDSDDEIMLQPKTVRTKAHGKPSTVGFSHAGGGFPIKSFGDRNFASPGFKPKSFSRSDVDFSPNLDYDDEIYGGTNRGDGFNQRSQGSRGSIQANGNYTRYAGAPNGYGSSSRLGYGQSNAADTEPDPIDEVVSSIKMLTEMFVRVENSKMEMAKEMEKTRMEMELKHCQMMLESQQQIIDAFTEALIEKKRKKKENENAKNSIKSTQA
ncbi:PREDICTED: uncharacterized protein LOC104812737 [Tarenaya hassleriana]|uniref:uncharacterized protein LOC104812737 n=1 Tax=Tarenaya hassleriana TaxID=28532 RepID=UPI00053C46A3|nr:PREDICTED: uncharacterized protein LOC104812737 [Tarenaya hassleriana]